MLTQIVIFFLAFVGIWTGAGLAISAVERLSRHFKLPAFAVSFLILGLCTSLSEFSVGVNAVLSHDPEVYVGNLLGASIVLFLLIIPLLAITGKRVKVNTQLQSKNLILALLVVGAPALMVFDGKVDRYEGWIAIVLYIVLIFGMEFKPKMLDRVNSLVKLSPSHTLFELAKIVLGLAIIFVSSHFVVEQTVYFSQQLGWSPFVMSLLLIAVGTNLPELSFVFRSIFMKSNQVAFGDYVGSAAANTLLFGVFTLVNDQKIILTNSYFVSFAFMISGLITFFVFARSKHTISRKEGCILLLIYVLFLVIEFARH